MATTIPLEAEQKIIERLKNGDDPADIILELCETENLNWPEAEALVKNIQSGNETEITLAQSPILIVIALATFIGGLGTLGLTVSNIAIIYHSYIGSGIASIGFIAYLFQYGGFFWGLGLLGLAMIIGSLRGMQAVWTAIFAKLGLFQE